MKIFNITTELIKYSETEGRLPYCVIQAKITYSNKDDDTIFTSYGGAYGIENAENIAIRRVKKLFKLYQLTYETDES